MQGSPLQTSIMVALAGSSWSHLCCIPLPISATRRRFDSMRIFRLTCQGRNTAGMAPLSQLRMQGLSLGSTKRSHILKSQMETRQQEVASLTSHMLCAQCNMLRACMHFTSRTCQGKEHRRHEHHCLSCGCRANALSHGYCHLSWRHVDRRLPP